MPPEAVIKREHVTESGEEHIITEGKSPESGFVKKTPIFLGRNR